MLFEDGLPNDVAVAMKALETAGELGVPWPFSGRLDLAMLHRLKERYPKIDVGTLVEKFLMWCVDARPWEDVKGKPVTVNWRKRIWTWAVNDERYRADASERFGTGGSSARRTHFAASPSGHRAVTEALERW